MSCTRESGRAGARARSARGFTRSAGPRVINPPELRRASKLNSLVRLFRLSRLRNAYLFRGFAVWAGLRVAFAIFGTHPSRVAVIVLLTTVAVAVYFDAKRRDEDVFLGNLGISGAAIAFMALPIPLLIEILPR